MYFTQHWQYPAAFFCRSVVHTLTLIRQRVSGREGDDFFCRKQISQPFILSLDLQPFANLLSRSVSNIDAFKAVVADSPHVTARYRLHPQLHRSCANCSSKSSVCYTETFGGLNPYWIRKYGTILVFCYTTLKRVNL